ncbi:MAG: L-seryl-tRNA(Sec) selenium transferase [Pelolinea sp.]|nr:L-seryl-tRNA(Sec) selenium transferase [Pelolinea sp.]
MPKTDFSSIPSVDSILQSPLANDLINTAGRELAVRSIRQSIDQIREKMTSGHSLPDTDTIIQQAENLVREWLKPSLVPVINASGIILHTNLGRAPLSEETIIAMRSVSWSYNNLEFDLYTGRRGKRSVHAEEILQKLTGAESALVVNNNAAAVLLTLSALAKSKKVVIPNSQLVEIGGGFRVPDVMRQSGAKLVAVGTTNRIHLSDYVQALEDGASLVLNAHSSNFKIIGFTTEPKLEEITAAAHSFSVPFVYDIGSGAMIDTSLFGLSHEPTVVEAMAAGADIICFSGDKLLGGPQAGIIIGKKDLLDKIKRHPLARAVRADKTCLAGITATLTHYLKGEALVAIPIWRMISLDQDTIYQRAHKWQRSIGQGEIIKGTSMVGGGSLPGDTLPTYLLALRIKKADKFLSALRSLPIPTIGRIENDQILFDPRTVLPNQEEIFVQNLNEVLHKKI